LSGRRPAIGLGLAARAFAAAARARATAYDLGALPIARIDGAAVFSVGNLRTGGSGKTPFAIWLAARLRERVPAVAIVLRGYRGAMSSRGGLVSAGAGPLVSAREAGDEAYLAALRAPPGVAVQVGADRVAAARRAARDGALAIVLDDGLQHRRLHRDCEIVLICPEDLDPRTPSIPAGPLRERPDALGRADLVAGWAADWEGRADAPALLLTASIAGLVDRSGRLEELGVGARAFLFAGIARPQRFLRDAAAGGLAVVGSRLFPDHHAYRPGELAAVAAEARRVGADLLVTTEKDLVRIGDAPDAPPLRALRLEVGVARGGERLDAAIDSALGAVFASLRPARW
jgi:tetraacyldisaccharide 4'-kinase